MASELKNLSEFEGGKIPSAADMKFGIVTAEWNHEITSALQQGAIATLLKHGATEERIISKWVPGSFELTLGAQYMAELINVDAIICIGCVIQGDTKHFDFICDAVAKGITDLNIKYNIPVIFGVLTPNTYEQAQDRAGGKHGNKGDEAAVTAIKMVDLKRSFKRDGKKVGF
ncbi:MAG: 6,7-dimethyl-8-ribityllumazine synthase [Bacteroidetes bacterium]|jgi:6,7-dimethyl-8-ribityllumazine synthase|nr:6,7-dimethyl-8-ribityllumazine synthase [Bacteroidota bacterium]